MATQEKTRGRDRSVKDELDENGVRRSIFEAEAKQAFARYTAELTFHRKLMGGIPKDPNLIEGWLASKAGIKDEQELRRAVLRTLAEQGFDEAGTMMDAKEITDETYEVIKTAAAQIAGSQQTTGFKVNANGLYVENRQFKAMLKECVNICFASERWGPTKKGPKSFTAERVFVTPAEISLGRMEPDGTEQIIGHISDQRGKRSTVGYHEYVERPVLTIGIEVLDNSIKPEWWSRIWVEAERSGFGALRSQGYGTFNVTKWERVA